MKIKNLTLAICNQFCRKGAWRNIFVTHNAFGIFSKYSHISRRSGKPKVAYYSKSAAMKAAEKMGQKHGVMGGIWARMLRIKSQRITPDELAALGLPTDYEEEFCRRKKHLLNVNRIFE